MSLQRQSSFGRVGSGFSVENAPLPRLAPHRRCTCNACRECRDNARWDRIFAKFEVKSEDNWDTKGIFQSTLRGW